MPLNCSHDILNTARNKRQFARDDCYWGAEAFADEALVRLQQVIDSGSGTLASSLRSERNCTCGCACG